MEALAALANDKISATQSEHAYATNRAKHGNLKTKQVAQKILTQKTEHLMDRKEIVMELKTNLDFVQAELVSKASKHRKKVEDGIFIYSRNYYKLINH